MTSFFIRRPIFSTVLSIVIVLAGLLASLGLPIMQYPQITPPTVSISATYSGANAETLAKVVAAPIEDELSGIEGLLYFTSNSSSDGQVSITATFDIGTDIDMAMVDTNNRVKAVEARLPEDVRRNGINVRKRSNDMLLVLALTSPQQTHDTLFLSNYAKLNMVDSLKRVPGVGDAQVFGARDYSMRVNLQMPKLTSLGLTVTDVSNAISAQNSQYAVGKVGDEPMPSDQQLTYSVTGKGRLLTAEDFSNIILKQDAGKGVVKLGDVAKVELGAQTYSMATFMNGSPALGIGINLQSGANALDVAEAVKAELGRMEKSFPEDVSFQIAYDTTTFIQVSIDQVVKTLVEAMILVILVVFLFLQNWRATLIPLLAVPVSLIGTLAGLWAFGFSINTLTLFAMVLAIGIVVDDAIVVLENVERLMHEKGLNAKDAAIEAMQEVSGALIAIVLVLCAVFIPVSFLGGIAGKLYQQFAVTVAIAIFLSGIVALTLTPALCALLLKPSHKQGLFFTWFNRQFENLTKFYLFLVNKTLRHRAISVGLFLAVCVSAAVLAVKLPTSFVPAEDQGMLMGSIQLPDNASLSRTNEFGEKYRQILAHDPNVSDAFVISGLDFIGGGNKSNAGAMFVKLKPWDERETTAMDLAGKFMGIGLGQADGRAMVFNPPAIMGLGSTGGFEFFLENRDDGDPQALSDAMNTLIGALQKDPRMASVSSFYRAGVPQLYVDVDEQKAISLGVAIPDVYATLQGVLSSVYVNDFNKSGKTYRVQMQADQQYRNDPEDIRSLYVRNAQGDLIPMASFVDVSFKNGPEMIQRYNGYVATKISGSAATGISSGDAIKAVDEVAAKVLPEGYVIEWTGQAYQEQAGGSTTYLAFGFAVLMVFLILAAQYEKWSLPVAVILAIPFALLGAYGALLIRGMPNDIYFQIGLVVLVGLAAKNAILIVEFAQQKVEEGFELADAAVEAAKLRFRPIVMTSLAFTLGVYPLMVSTGAGSASRQSMGTGVFGGMILATFLATVFVPLFFLLLSRKAPLGQKVKQD
ncbi:efflux RND transporter permease subunit [Pseudomonas sp. CFBP 13719]|uniref:efflux RND transporter permease subunit n=1 Tax=Pseudomonas sp. CFBP 13719 TaxID=2775303 RepID=UPI00177F6296|nr:multidrug efflux RND transporter permease subunit [Pseudomonas sp. CFBP 13719]MBD8681609.1 multidrug efflux RND transporter permease subunit [Pseudomonas sp. CFBP 13719]